MNLIIAFIVEAVFGYPHFIFSKIKHPVVWIGAVIDCLEKKFNKSRNNFAMGVFSMAIMLAIVILISLLITKDTHPIVEIICMASLLATRSLYSHVADVYVALCHPADGAAIAQDLDTVQPNGSQYDKARKKLAKIVGRDTEHLNESEISKASIESLAESFCDGVVAPLFWGALFGLAGIAAYKAINTADSMIGHKTPRFLAYGWAAARADDVANYIPARLSALLIIIASGARAKFALKTTLNDARKHASPNSGFPEAAMAGALGITLGGARNYDGELHNAPIIGGQFCHCEEALADVAIQSHTKKDWIASPQAARNDEFAVIILKKALKIYIIACSLLFVILLIPEVFLYL
jgi:adenosylcobinamide-phosphate synthase